MVRLQQSDTRPQDAVLCNETKVEHNHLVFKRSAEAFTKNLRAYIDTISASIKCSMDVHSTDGKDMLLHYVTSYVSKWKDGLGKEGMYSHSTVSRSLYLYCKSGASSRGNSSSNSVY